jgi:nicotinate-nucleotide adenylyltransferase
MKIGIFGGTFDPVHYGHLILAESCREECGLDQVWLLPAAISPHKQGQPPTGAEHRVAMLQLAIGGHEQLRVETTEVERGEVSYTVDTLETLHERQPTDELFFLMGSDSLQDLPAWKQPERICELALPIVVRRPGAGEPSMGVFEQLVSADRLEQIHRYSIDMPWVDISSSNMRQRVADGRSIRFRTPRAVEAYIASHGLYRE